MLLTVLTILLITICFLAVAVIIARLAFPAPAYLARKDTTALPPAGRGALQQALAHRCASHQGQTGVAFLANGEEAFAARILLANAAVSSIDAQYYIWRNDMTGYLLLDALRRAADRGVRVRLLLDDNGIAGLDPALAELDTHPNAEVRLYNPFNLRRFKPLAFGFDFFRLNRRMHNKSLTVDGRATIMGGRNIGDEYFGAGAGELYFDLDVLAVGNIVPQVSADFDRYWAARAVHPLGSILKNPVHTPAIASGLSRFSHLPQKAEYRDILQSSKIVAELTEGRFGLEWTTAVLVSDDPIKGEGAVPREDLLATRLMQAVGTIKHRFDGVSPYFVPGKAGVKAFKTLTNAGVTVRMLTNSLEATDVLPVHAGYTKNRKNMLRAGVQLFELRREAAPAVPPKKKIGPLGSSGSSLHAKTFAVDGARIFVGSFNFDPRSTTLNTEMGLLIESTKMANAMHAVFDTSLADMTWRVHLRSGSPVWNDLAENTEKHQEPGTTLYKRMALAVIGWLPVEWLL